MTLTSMATYLAFCPHRADPIIINSVFLSSTHLAMERILYAYRVIFLGCTHCLASPPLFFLTWQFIKFVGKREFVEMSQNTKITFYTGDTPVL